MARAKLRDSVVRLAVAVSTSWLLLSCNQRSDEQQQPRKRFSGVVDDKFYIRPRVSGDGRTLVKGCCTFKIGSAQLTKLPGDVDGRLVRGRGYQIEIAFGDGVAPLAPALKSVGQRSIDGVDVTQFKAGSQQVALQATIPLSAEAAKHGIDFPELQVVGRCETPDGCSELARTLGSIRF